MQRITSWIALGTLSLLATVHVAPVDQACAQRYVGGDVFQGGCEGGNCGPAVGGLPVGRPAAGDETLIGEPGFGEEIAYDSGCADGLCGDPLCGSCGGSRISAGVEFTIVKPHFENNVAFTTLESDGATFENTTTTEFDYNNELAPRVWLEFLQMGTLGLRASYWQFDNAAALASGSPPDNGFGRITPPDFGDVDLSTTVPGSTYTASTDLNAYTIDIEGTKSFDCGLWGWMASAGLRFAEVDQSYNSTLVNAAGDNQGSIDFHHRIQGIGPTVSVRTQRPFTSQLSLFGFARGALLFGDAESTLEAVEDQDLDTSFSTQTFTERDDLLPIAEMQVGFQWTPPTCGAWCPYVHLAMEGQLWNGAGNASSEESNLGFYGLNVALGMDW